MRSRKAETNKGEYLLSSQSLAKTLGASIMIQPSSIPKGRVSLSQVSKLGLLIWGSTACKVFSQILVKSSVVIILAPPEDGEAPPFVKNETGINSHVVSKL